MEGPPQPQIRTRVQGWPKRWTPGSINVRRNNCGFLPAGAMKTQLLHLIFTEPGVHLLSHPCSAANALVMMTSMKIMEPSIWERRMSDDKSGRPPIKTVQQIRSVIVNMLRANKVLSRK